MAASRDTLLAFELKSVRWLDRNASVGSGAFGRVQKVSINGVIHAAKKLHDILVNSEISPTERSAVIVKFRRECLTLSRLKHPNIVHFVGVHKGRGPADMSLIMECLDTDLAKFVESHNHIPLSVTLSILVDISYGLVYLHTQHPPIIHRDLSAHNILLTKDLHAKIADLGMSKLFSTRQQMTMAPGHLTYMAPECLFDKPEYDEQIDIFSFGHLALFVVIGRDPGTDKKREAAMKEISYKHCLRSLVTQCLKQYPNERPIAETVNKKLKDLCMKHPKTVEDLAQVLMEDNEKLQSENGQLMRMVDDLERLAAEKRDESNQLREELTQLKNYGIEKSQPQGLNKVTSSDNSHSNLEEISHSDTAEELYRYKQETHMYKEELDETKAKLTAVSQQLKVAQDQLKEASIREDTIVERSEAAIGLLDHQNQILRDQVQELKVLAQHNQNQPQQEKQYSSTQLAPIPAPRSTKSLPKGLPSQPFNQHSSCLLVPPVPAPRTTRSNKQSSHPACPNSPPTAPQLLSSSHAVSDSDCTYSNVEYRRELEKALGTGFYHLCSSCNDLHPFNTPCMHKSSTNDLTQTM